MPRPSNALREFVKLYVSGPAHLVGQWEKCAVAARCKVTPVPTDPMVQRMVADARGAYVPPAAPAPLKGLEDAAAALEDAAAIDWKKIRRLLSDTIESIATGEVRATAAQVSMVKLIVEKAEAQSKVDSTVSNVVVLPQQGSGADTRIDPVWLARIRKLESVEGDAKS